MRLAVILFTGWLCLHWMTPAPPADGWLPLDRQLSDSAYLWIRPLPPAPFYRTAGLLYCAKVQVRYIGERGRRRHRDRVYPSREVQRLWFAHGFGSCKPARAADPNIAAKRIKFRIKV